MNIFLMVEHFIELLYRNNKYWQWPWSNVPLDEQAAGCNSWFVINVSSINEKYN